MSMYYPSTSALTEELRKLHGEGHDLSQISKEIEKLDAAKKARILQGLRGVADLATLEKRSMRRFVIAFWEHNEYQTLEGVEVGDTSEVSEDDEGDEYRVFIEAYGGGISSFHETMKLLRKSLDRAGIIHHIEYIDK